MTENNKLLASVNGKDIHQSDVYEFLSGIEEGARFNSPQGIKQITDELINQELILDDAIKNGLDNDDEFQRELAIVKNNMIKNYAMHKIFSNISLSDDEIKDYYEKNKETLFSPITYTASHILVDDIKRAEDIIDEINNGLSFEEAAKKYSMDPSAQSGGSLGTFPKGVMVKEFQDGLDILKIGEISKPIKTQFGYHIIKLDDKNKGEDIKFEDIKDQVKSTLEMVKRQERYIDKVNELSKNAEVKKYY